MTSTQQFIASRTAGVDTLIRLGEASFTGLEKFVALNLPAPISVNEIWRPVKRAGHASIIRSAKYNAWLAEAGFLSCGDTAPNPHWCLRRREQRRWDYGGANAARA